MCLDDLEIRRHLAVSHEASVRQRAFEFLTWSRDSAGLCPKSGDESWGAIDILREDRVIARVFPKEAGLLKVSNLAAFEDSHYGPQVALTELGEWSFDLTSSRFDMATAKRCVSDQIHAT